jgi:hypothetical protein
VAAFEDQQSFARHVGSGVVDDLTCPVPWCQTGVCNAAARFLIAARDEVPAGCANCRDLTERPQQLRLIVGAGEARLTPGARSLLALRPGGAAPRQVLALLEEGRLVFLEPRTPRPLRSTALVRRTQPPVLSAPPRPGAEDKVAWIKLRVVDDASGEPLPGVVLKVTQPNRKTFDYTTRPDGAVEIHGIDPGTCDVACDLENARNTDTYAFVTIGEQPSSARANESGDEASDAGKGKAGEEPNPNDNVRPSSGSSIAKQGVRIAHVEEHKVRTGESIKSLAEQNGMTWQELARFNWDTDVPDEINEKLRDEVGCTKRAPDGVNYSFDDSDEPGIVCIAKPWSVEGLVTDQTHTIRVQSVTGEVAGINYIRLCIYDDAEQPAAELVYAIHDFGGAVVCEGKTDAQGRIRYENVELKDFDLVVAGHTRTIPSVAYDDEWIDVFLPWFGYIRLIVRDDHKQSAGGLSFQIADENGKAIDSGSTDAEGKIRVERTPLGDYELAIGEFKRTIPAVGYDDEWVDVFLPAEEANHGR